MKGCTVSLTPFKFVNEPRLVERDLKEATDQRVTFREVVGSTDWRPYSFSNV